MSYYQKYKMEFQNVEGQMVKHLIEDLFSGETNPYGISYTAVDNGGGTQTVTVNFTSFPAGTTSLRLEANDAGGVVVDYETQAGSSSPMIWTDCPSGTFTFIFYFVTPDGQPNYVLDDLDGITDELNPTDNPSRLISNNNGEDKLSTISGTQLVLEFVSSTEINISKFLRGSYSDRRYRTTSTINDRVIFRGFLQISEAQEDFLPHPNPQQLVATDQLGSLKNKDLVNADGKNPTGFNKIIKYIAWILKQTGIEQNINVVFNVREEEAGTIAAEPEKHFYNHQYINAKTFEKEVGSCEDCYTALNKILKYTNFIGQRNGEWWIKNVDEFDNQPDYVAVYDKDGEFIEMLEGATYEKEIRGNVLGIAQPMSWSQHSSKVAFGSPAKFGKLTYKFSNPKEIPCNIDFERGDVIDDSDPLTKTYELECWTMKAVPSLGPATDATCYIRRNFNANNYETERFVVITPSSSYTDGAIAQAEPFPVSKGDRITLSVDFKLPNNITGSDVTFNIMNALIIGISGTYIFPLGNQDSNGKWLWTGAITAIDNSALQYTWVRDDVDETKWQTATFELADVPESGDMYIGLQQFNQHSGSFDTDDVHYANLSVTIYPFINNTYQKYTGIYHKVSQSENNPEKVDDEVYISDPYRSIFKGALHKYNGTGYVFSGLFWNASVYIGGPPDPTYLHPFGFIQAFNTWNQIRNLNRIFRGSIRGITSDSVDLLDRCDLPSIFHTYRLKDIDEHTNDKKFMLLSYNMNLRLCEFESSSLREVHDEIAGKKYDDAYEFKFITQ